MSEPLMFRVNGEPHPKKRPRVSSTGTHTPEATKEAEANVASYGALAWRQPPSSALFGVECAFVVTRAVPGDIDNLCKTVLDGLNRIIWHDDKQVVELKAKIHRASDPKAVGYAVIQIWEVE